MVGVVQRASTLELATINMPPTSKAIRFIRSLPCTEYKPKRPSIPGSGYMARLLYAKSIEVKYEFERQPRKQTTRDAPASFVSDFAATALRCSLVREACGATLHRPASFTMRRLVEVAICDLVMYRRGDGGKSCFGSSELTRILAMLGRGNLALGQQPSGETTPASQ